MNDWLIAGYLESTYNAPGRLDLLSREVHYKSLLLSIQPHKQSKLYFCQNLHQFNKNFKILPRDTGTKLKLPRIAIQTGKHLFAKVQLHKNISILGINLWMFTYPNSEIIIMHSTPWSCCCHALILCSENERGLKWNTRLSWLDPVIN